MEALFVLVYMDMDVEMAALFKMSTITCYRILCTHYNGLKPRLGVSINSLKNWDSLYTWFIPPYHGLVRNNDPWMEQVTLD